jgi:hypothetical protein
MLPFMTSLRNARKLSPSPDRRNMDAPPSTPFHLTTSLAPTPEPDDSPESSSIHHPTAKAKGSRLSAISFLPNVLPQLDAGDQAQGPMHTSHLELLRAAFNPFHVRLILTNTGSVARDHLALERTFLSYVRTSLAIASAGVGARSLLH